MLEWKFWHQRWCGLRNILSWIKTDIYCRSIVTVDWNFFTSNKNNRQTGIDFSVDWTPSQTKNMIRSRIKLVWKLEMWATKYILPDHTRMLHMLIGDISHPTMSHKYCDPLTISPQVTKFLLLPQNNVQLITY